MKLFSFLVFFFVCHAGTAHAQTTTLAVNIKTAKFTWAWTQGTGGVVDYFQVRCLQTGLTAPVLGPKTTATARDQLVLDVVKAPGDYKCTVQAGNIFGESGGSNEVSFRAGDVPLAATSFTVSGGTP
jgi:hypothetical protein